MSAAERGRGLPYALVGNGSITALVHPDTGIDWLCLPRIDGPSVFGRLLDAGKGGSWSFQAEGGARSSRSAYDEGTNVLRTVVEAEDGRFEVIDFAPWGAGAEGAEAPVALVRIVRPLEGEPVVRVAFDPRPDYGREAPAFTEHADGVSFTSAGSAVHVQGAVSAQELRGDAPVRLRRPLWFRLTCGAERPLMGDLASAELALKQTTEGWRSWSAGVRTSGFAEGHVLRSALCLKLLASPETGATVAAATTSVPEAIGEPRTWDYRFCWLRDSVFTVEALRRVGHSGEGHAFLDFVLKIAESGPLQPLYGIGGERDLEEWFLEDFDGFLGTRPVRIGNAAALQTQHDLMGEIVLAMRTLLTEPGAAGADRWFALLERMVAESVAGFTEPDLGIWEYREGPRLHVFSRAMCWAAVHHGAALARHAGRTELADEWTLRADAMEEEILERGYNAEEGMFTQCFEHPHPDAANLLLPSLGLIDAKDVRFRSTLDRYRELLVTDRGVMRYLHDDDFGSPSSTFTICSFWWCEALALAGEIDEAKARFETLVSHVNPVGLMSEDLSAETGELLGNFPQAYTHVGLIQAAMAIGAIERGDTRGLHAWST